MGEQSVTHGPPYRLTTKHLEDAKTPANQVISLPSEAFLRTPLPVGYAKAHPRLQALDLQPSALLPSEATAVCIKKFVIIRVKKHVAIRVKTRRSVVSERLIGA